MTEPSLRDVILSVWTTTERSPLTLMWARLDGQAIEGHIFSVHLYGAPPLRLEWLPYTLTLTDGSVVLGTWTITTRLEAELAIYGAPLRLNR